MWEMCLWVFFLGSRNGHSGYVSPDPYRCHKLAVYEWVHVTPEQSSPWTSECMCLQFHGGKWLQFHKTQCSINMWDKMLSVRGHRWALDMWVQVLEGRNGGYGHISILDLGCWHVTADSFTDSHWHVSTGVSRVQRGAVGEFMQGYAEVRGNWTCECKCCRDQQRAVCMGM